MRYHHRFYLASAVILLSSVFAFPAQEEVSATCPTEVCFLDDVITTTAQSSFTERLIMRPIESQAALIVTVLSNLDCEIKVIGEGEAREIANTILKDSPNHLIDHLELNLISGE